MTFEEAAKRYLNAPTKKFGNAKSETVRHCVMWMADDKPKGLLDKKTKKVYAYSPKYHSKRPELSIVWDETSGRFKGRQMSSINSLDAFDMTESVRNDKGLGPCGINNYTKVLRALCNFSRKRLSVKFDDFPEFEEMEEEVKREEWLELEDAAKLIRWLDPLRASMMRMALATGLRNSNVRMMLWEWISPDQKEINIPSRHMKGGEAHNIQVNPQARKVLQMQLKVREQLLKTYPDLKTHLYRDGTNPARPALDYVFIQGGESKWSTMLGRNHRHQSLGNPFCRSSMTNPTWKKAVRLAGLPPWVRFHSLRHTFATWHVQNGSTESEIMVQGGWSTPASVARYAHQNKAHKKKVSRRLDEMHAQL